MNEKAKYGARVYPMGKDGLLVKQTVKSGSGYTDKYKVSDTYHHERHVKLDNDAAIAQAIRDALRGKPRE